MPRVIDTDTTDVIGIEELIDTLETGHFDGNDEENFVSFGPALKKLANNRAFLADLMIGELKQRCEGQLRDNQYSAQVMMLHRRSDRFVLRANFWPAMTDSIVRQSGTDPFFYGTAHDHNFSFLTVGYFGPGYWSDYYEYDYGEVVGYPGEPVDLRFMERSKLDEGKVMLYRIHRDVHLQLPADALSVSINILETSPSAPFRDQCRFNVNNSTLDGIMTRMSLEPMLAITAHMGGDEGTDLLDQFVHGHPSDRMRWLALKARASQAPDIGTRLAVLETGTASGSLLVAHMARQEIAKVERGRDWIERGPAPLPAPRLTVPA